jgi:hypothetical protein
MYHNKIIPNQFIKSLITFLYNIKKIFHKTMTTLKITKFNKIKNLLNKINKMKLLKFNKFNKRVFKTINNRNRIKRETSNKMIISKMNNNKANYRKMDHNKATILKNNQFIKLKIKKNFLKENSLMKNIKILINSKNEVKICQLNTRIIKPAMLFKTNFLKEVNHFFGVRMSYKVMQDKIKKEAIHNSF